MGEHGSRAIQLKAPLLYHVLHMQSRIQEGPSKCGESIGAAHFPRICSSIAILLKEQNREMCGLQFCYCEKQVAMYFIN